jgi:hypothetical protein
MAKLKPVGGPDLLIALAAENSALAQRESLAWLVVADLARVLTLRTAETQDETGRALADEFEKKARADLYRLETSPAYAALPLLGDTHSHLHKILADLLETI